MTGLCRSGMKQKSEGGQSHWKGCPPSVWSRIRNQDPTLRTHRFILDREGQSRIMNGVSSSFADPRAFSRCPVWVMVSPGSHTMLENERERSGQRRLWAFDCEELDLELCKDKRGNPGFIEQGCSPWSKRTDKGILRGRRQPMALSGAGTWGSRTIRVHILQEAHRQGA